MKNNFFEPLVLENIPFNFAIILPVNGRDTLCIYNDRTFALKSYGYLQSNPNSDGETTFSSVLLRSIGLGYDENKINFIVSERDYKDIMHADDRFSHLIFSWEGFVNRSGRDKLNYLFNSMESKIYNNFKEWLRVKKIEHEIYSNNLSPDLNYNEIENIERDLEESLSVLVYQGERVSHLIKNKNKKMKRISIATSFVYIIFITAFFIARYFL